MLGQTGVMVRTERYPSQRLEIEFGFVAHWEVSLSPVGPMTAKRREHAAPDNEILNRNLNAFGALQSPATKIDISTSGIWSYHQNFTFDTNLRMR